MIADPAFQQILDNIPEMDRTALLTQHGVTGFTELVAKKAELQQCRLKDVCSAVQMCLVVVCTYLESLDSTSSFTWASFENFCDFQDNSGDNIIEDLGGQSKTVKETSEDADPEGYNLTAEERKQMEQSVEEDPLTMKVRGFSSRSLRFDFDEYNKNKLVEGSSEKTEVAFNGSVFYVRKCYYFQQPDGERVIVAIRKFTRNERKAICVLVVPFIETVMGPGLEEEPPIGVPVTYKEDQTGLPSHVQVREKVGSEPIIPLPDLEPCHEPAMMPELIYERQQVGQPPHNFGYVYENDGINRGEEREEFRFVDFFAGAGGFHQGMMQVPGFKGVAAVEWCETACETFTKNNPGTLVFCQKVEDFIKENGPTPADFRKKHGRVPVIGYCSPCQSFSGSNRAVDHNSEKDLYRKNLSLGFINAMKVTGALIGVFENVEGMWRRPNVYFLKKIVLDHLRAGNQVRVRLHRAHVFGDPQARPRLIIYAAKKYVEMPNVIETHGPGKHPFMTVGTAFKALEKTLEKVKNNPGMTPIPNLEGSSKVENEKDVLTWDKPAGTIRCGGRAWHPTKDRAITVREAATLQSYPIYYEFLGSVTEQYKQVGNAVPGKMAKAVAMAIAESLRFVYDEEEDDGMNDAVASMEEVEVKPKKVIGVRQAATRVDDGKMEVEEEDGTSNAAFGSTEIVDLSTTE